MSWLKVHSWLMLLLCPRSATTDPATEVEKSALTEAIKAQIEEDDYETVLGLRVKKAR